MTAKYRNRVRDILVATKVFRDEEIDVAIELFDEVYGTPITVDKNPNYAPVSSDYFFLGAFTPEEELAGFACYGPTPGTDRTYEPVALPSVHFRIYAAGGTMGRSRKG